jgi:hypothetical protein
MNPSITIALVLFLNASGMAALITLDMEGPPVQPPNTSYLIPQYFEDGFHLRPKGPIKTTAPYDLARNGGGISFYPQNGGAFLQLLSGNSLVVSKVDGGAFDVISVSLAEYSTVFPVPVQIGFRGFQANNSFADAFFTTDGVIDGTGPLIDFQTFNFPSSFSHVVRIESLTDGYSLDNLVVNTLPALPEPGVTELLGAAAGTILMLRRRGQ